MWKRLLQLRTINPFLLPANAELPNDIKVFRSEYELWIVLFNAAGKI
jgi:hypothetical protein